MGQGRSHRRSQAGHSCVVYAGQINSNTSNSSSVELDAVALGMSFVNVSGVSVGMGMASGAYTLCSQAYGFKNYKKVGIFMQRGILILGLCLFPVWALWMNTESVFLLFQQDPCVSRLAGSFVAVQCFSVPFFFLYFMMSAYLQSQSIMWIFPITMFLVNILNVCLLSIFIFWLDLSVVGVSGATLASNVALVLVLVGYVCARGLHKQTWGGGGGRGAWSWESLAEWGHYSKYAVPGMLMIAFEWWSYEIGLIVVGSIGVTEMAVNAVIMNILTLLYTIPYALRLAVTVRVGNELGAGNAQQAKRASYVTLTLLITESAVTVIFLQAAKEQIGRVFSSNQEVIAGVSEVLLYASVLVSGDHIQGGLAGVLCGCGKQVLGAAINFVALYLFGLPLGIILALVVRMGSLGLWIGLLSGSLVSCVSFIIILLCTNWQRESEKAVRNSETKSRQRLKEEGRPHPVSAVTNCSICVHDKDVDVMEDHCNKRRDSAEEMLALQTATEELEKEDDDAAMEEETELETAFLFTGEQQEDTEEERKVAVAANAATRNSPIAANTSPPRPSSSGPLREGTTCRNYKRLKLVLYRLGMLAIAGVVLLGGVLARALVQPSSSATEALANCTSTET